MSTVAFVERVLGRTHGKVAHRLVFVQAALVGVAAALPLTAGPVYEPLPLPGNVSVFVADLVVVAALACWALLRLIDDDARVPIVPPALRWPFLVFALALIPGIVRGFERYNAPIVGQPVRLVLYAGIAAAVLSVSPRHLYRGLVVALYTGVVWQATLAVYSLAAGISQTDSWALSTGGTRVLGLRAASMLSGGLLLAILNLEIDRNPRRRIVHLTVIGLAIFGILVSFGRTNFVATAVVLSVVLFHFVRRRSVVGGAWRLGVPVVIALVIGGFVVSPLGRTLVDRVSANPLEDRSFQYRLNVYESALSGMRSGEWDQTSVQDLGAEYLRNPGFETGTDRWGVQGGTIQAVSRGTPGFGAWSLRLETRGVVVDEGIYSEPVMTTFGETWSFSVWLAGDDGGERFNVSIWEYTDGNEGVAQTNVPITLTPTPTEYFVRATVTHPETRYVRALVRTRDRRQAVTVFGDHASMTSAGRPRPERGVPFATGGGGVVPPGTEPGVSSPNRLSNAGFENGAAGWETRDATVTTITSNNPAFGQSTAVVETAPTFRAGIATDEQPAERGDIWTFSIWLRASQESERMTLAIEEYDRRGSVLHATAVPVSLTIWPTEYFVTSAVSDRRTTAIRAAIWSRAAGSPASFLADGASLTRADSQAPVPIRDDAPRATGGGLQIDEPLLGLGFGRSFEFVWDGAVYRLDGDPHNSYIWLLGGGGVLALLAFLAVIVVSVRDSCRRLRVAAGPGRLLIVWSLAVLALFLINTLTEPYLSDPTLLLALWVVLSVPAAVSASNSRPGDQGTSGP